MLSLVQRVFRCPKFRRRQVIVELREHQKEGAKNLRSSFAKGHRAPLYVAPCGSGKTLLFCHIAQQASRKGNRTLILVHRRELLSQAHRSLESFGVEHSVITSGMPFVRSNVQVASVQTLVRRMAKYSWRPDLIVVDEAHHLTGGSTWGKILSFYSADPDAHKRTAVLGVTASPVRLDGRGLGVDAGGYFDDMIIGPSPKGLIAKGYLSQPFVYSVPVVDVSGVKTIGGDYAKGELAEAMNKPKITGNAIDHYKKFCPGEPAIAFCCSIAHAERVSEDFRNSGIPSATIDGKLDSVARAKRVEDLSTGQIKVMTSCDIVSEGFDLPVVSAAILLRPTQSTGLYIQQTGRALRMHPGKKRAIIIDSCANWRRHGFPDDDRDWSLDGKKRSKQDVGERAFNIRQCKRCSHVHRPAPACPKCGYVYPVKSREIEEVEGSLELIDRDKMNQLREEEYQRRIRMDERKSAKTLEELIELGRSRGYKNPAYWARNVLKGREKKRPRNQFMAA